MKGREKSNKKMNRKMNKKMNKKTVTVFNIITVCVIALLIAGLFLLQSYKKSGYAYEGEYVYVEKDGKERMILRIEYVREKDVLYIDMTEIYHMTLFEESDNPCNYNEIITYPDLILTMSDMDAFLAEDEENLDVLTYPYEYKLEFDKKGVTLFKLPNVSLSYIGNNEMYFYKNGWLNHLTAEFIQMIFAVIILIQLTICIIVNAKNHKKKTTEIDESFYGKFVIGEMIYINDGFKGMEDYFEKNVLDRDAEFSLYHSKICDKEIQRPEYKLSIVDDSDFRWGKGKKVKQIEILDSDGNESEYVVIGRNDEYILKQRGGDMTVAVYKLRKILSVMLIFGFMAVTIGGCRQLVNDKYTVMGRIVSIEDNVLRINRAVPEEYSSVGEEEKELMYIFDKDDYFTSDEEYSDVYFVELKSDYGYAEFALSEDWHNYYDEESILEDASHYIYEIIIENGKVEACRKTDYYCLSKDNVPRGMVGEVYCGTDTVYPILYGDLVYGDLVYDDFVYDMDSTGEENRTEEIRWEFYGDGIVLTKRVSNKKVCYLKISNMDKLRVYRINDALDNSDRIWIDTPGEDLIIKIKYEACKVYSYPGGAYLDEEGELRYNSSDVTKSVYEVTDLKYEVEDVPVNVVVE